MLSGIGIKNEMYKGKIRIDPFNDLCINPNSYDLHLGNELLVYSNNELFVNKDNPSELIKIPKEGLRLQPGILYLATTLEWTETYAPWAPSISGKSSLGRLGLNVHATAGFGDVGFCGEWTLELSVVQPLTIFANIKICQIVYHRVEGEIKDYDGKYQGQRNPQPYKPDY